jgi:DNA-directed RNA polymerase specialized sigma24 family protein
MVRDRQEETAQIRMADPLTIEDLYKDQWAPLVRLALVMTGDRSRAEDIVHDVFVRLATRPLPLDPPSYVRRMVVNATRDHHRRIRVERRLAPGPPPPVLQPDVDEVIVAVQRLPTRQRQVLGLRYYADMSLDQIAHTLDCPVGTVKSLIHRGIETLRKELKQ